jgi:hypothetical protein
MTRRDNLERDRSNDLSRRSSYVRDYDDNQTAQARQQQTINSLERQVESDQSNIQIAQSELLNARQNANQASRDLSWAQSNLNAALPSYNSALDNYNQQKDYATRLLAYLNQVKANYAAELQQAKTLGQTKGSEDGRKEATERATEPGTKLGLESGATEGTRKGQQDADLISFVKGFKNGLANGQQIAAESFASGAHAGEDIAMRKATLEVLPVGYNSQLADAVATVPTQTETIDITDSIPDAAGSSAPDLRHAHMIPQAVESPVIANIKDPTLAAPRPLAQLPQVPETQHAYFAAPCDGLRTTEFIDACKTEYLTNYDSSYKKSYVSTFNTAYATSFVKQAQEKYDAAVVVDNPSETQRGIQAGAKNKGIVAGFEASIGKASEQQLAAGKAKLLAELEQAHLLVLRSVSLDETSGDGVLSPLEPARLSLVIDNVGGQDSAIDSLTLKITNKVNATELSTELRKLPAIKAKTRVILKGVLSAKSTAALVGQKVELEGLVEIKSDDAAADIVGTFSAHQDAHFPLELIEIVPTTALKVGQQGKAKFRFKNQTKGDLPATNLKIAQTPSNLIVQNVSGVLARATKSQETVEVELGVKPDASIDETSPARVTVDTLNENEAHVMTQIFEQLLPISRTTKLGLTKISGEPIKTPIPVRAGSQIQVVAKLACPSATQADGPYDYKFLSATDAAVKPPVGTTTGALSRQCSTARVESTTFTIQVPSSVKGKKVTVSMGLFSGATLVHKASFIVDAQ